MSPKHSVESSWSAHNEFGWKHLAAITLVGNLALFGYYNHEAISSNVSAAIPDDDLDRDATQTVRTLTDQYVFVDCQDDPTTPSGTPVDGKVRALTMPPPVGMYLPPVMTLDTNICLHLPEVSTAPESLSMREANAVFVVLHETEHINQVSSEAQAECNAGQKLPGVLYDNSHMDHGLSEHMAQTLVDDNAKWMSPKYIDRVACRPGGDYDLQLSSVYQQPASLS